MKRLENSQFKLILGYVSLASLTACGPLPSNPNNQLSPKQIAAAQKLLQAESLPAAGPHSKQSGVYAYDAQSHTCKDAAGNTGHNMGVIGQCSLITSLGTAGATSSSQMLELSGAVISAPLDGAQLPEADFEGASFISGSSLAGANLKGANLSNADLSQKMNLREAKLQKADLSGTILFGADLEGAQLEGASVAHADFTNANLSRTNFKGAKIRRSSFEGSDFDFANLCGLKMGAIREILAGAKSVTDAQVDLAIIRDLGPKRVRDLSLTTCPAP